MLDLPLNLMVKINFTNADLAWEVTESTHTSKITYEHSSTAISLIASKKLLIIEPYAGLGYISGTNDFAAVGDVTVLDSSITLAQREGIETSDLYYFAGLNVNLLGLSLGAEYMNILGNSRITGKLTIGF